MNRTLAAILVTSLVGGTAYAQDPMPDPMATAEAAPAAAEASNIKITAFADAFYNYMSRKNSGADAAHRAYARNNGFQLSFAGADIVYDTDRLGATLSLRFGPSVPVFYAADQGPLGIDNILQAFGTWKATDKLSIDFGQFGTIYGAEVAESWINMNYTRGGLYYAMQPFWHTGVRAKFAATDELTLTGMVVNGVNNAIDDDEAKPSIGVQAAYAGGPFNATLGYLGSLSPSTDAYFDHFVDLVVSATAGPINLLLNADLGMDTKRDMADDGMFFGVSLAAGLPINDIFGVAVRGEYLGDPDGVIYGAGDANVITGTGTLEFKPVESGNLIIRWDNRFEKANKDLYADRDATVDMDGVGAANSDIFYQSVLGLVVKTD